MIGAAKLPKEDTVMPTQSSAREIAETLRAEILAGEHAPGSQLRYAEIAERFGGVSASTVQRAMGRLEALGLVEYAPGRGTFVTTE